MRRLQGHGWPGNIRQLRNVIEQCAILCDGDTLEVPAEALPVRRNRQAVDTMHGMFDETPTLEEVKKRYISHLLRTTHGNMPRAAAILDVDRRSLYRMVTRYQLGTPPMHRVAARCDHPVASAGDSELDA